MSARDYIEERSIPVPFVGCWLWLLSLGSHGYGQASTPEQRVDVAHRVSYRAFKGSIPPGMLVQHNCDNKWCVNPDHLSLGTDKTNAEDKQRKGRAATKLSPDIVVAIRQALATGRPQRAIAASFNISQRMVLFIKQGQSWNHIR